MNQDTAIRAAAWTALLLALYGLWVALGNAGMGAARWWVTSDSLYPVHVFIDTVLEGNSFSGWKFSIAPCWFPDMFLTTVLMAIARNPITATLLAGFVQPVLLVVGLRMLCKAAGWEPGLLGEVGALAAGTGAALVLISAPSEHPGLSGQLFLPQTHVGSLILTIYALALVVAMLRSMTAWRIALYSALCFLGGFSDLMFVVQTLVPLTAVLVFAGASRASLAILGSGWAATLIGYAVNALLINTTPVAAQSDRRIAQAVTTFCGGFFSHLRAFDLLHIFAAIWIVVATVFVVRKIRSAEPRDRMAAIALATIVLSGVASIGAVIVGGSTTLTHMNDYRATLRYLHPAFLLPVLTLPFVTLLALERTIASRVVVRSIGAVIAGIALLPALSAAGREQRGSIAHFEHPVVSFIDELASKEGLRTGVAGYWHARLITLLSRTGTRAYAVHADMKPFLWVSNAEWYRPLFDGARPRTDFVVLDDPLFRLDTPAAVKVFGEPARVATYQGVRVLLYQCRTCSLAPEQRAGHWLDEPLNSFQQELTTPIKDLTLRPNETTTLLVTVTNPGPETWESSGRRPVNLSYKLVREGTFVREGERTGLPHVLGSGRKADVQLRITAPPESGRYTVRISLLQETIAWFDAAGGAPLDVPLTVR